MSEREREPQKSKEGIEGQFEKFSTREEVFGLVGVHPEKCIIGQEEYEDGVLYRLDFKTSDGSEYMYCRAGTFEGKPEFTTTEIIETTKTTLPTPIYRLENGVWKKLGFAKRDSKLLYQAGERVSEVGEQSGGAKPKSGEGYEKIYSKQEQIGIMMEMEYDREKILDVLEAAYDNKSVVELVVLEPSGELGLEIVFVESFDKDESTGRDMLYVSLSASAPVKGVDFNDVQRVKHF